MPAMIGMTLASTALSAASTIAGGNAAAQQGQMQQVQYNYRADQQEQAANEARAASQRQAFERRHEAELLGSKLQARAAASGGGATDATVLDLGGDIAGRGELAALTEMYKGENRARGLEMQAEADRYSGEMALIEGQAKKKASRLAAAGTIVGGMGSAFKTYHTGGYG